MSAERLAALNPRLYNFQVGNFDYSDEELHLGQLQGKSLHALSTCLQPQNLLLSTGVEQRQNSLSCSFLSHLHNVETRFYCPQAFLSLDFQYKDDVSEVKKTFWD